MWWSCGIWEITRKSVDIHGVEGFANTVMMV